MHIPVLAVFVSVAAICVADDKAVIDQIEDLVSDNIQDEIADSDEHPEVSAAVRYMIPVPIRVVVPVPVPQQQPYQQPYPERDRYPDRDPIIAVPIGLTPGRYGRRPSWRPIGPPVIAVPVGSATRYPLPDDDDYDYERRALASPQRIRTAPTVRRTRSIVPDLKAEASNSEQLISGMSPKEVPVINRADNPLKVSSKSSQKGSKLSKQRYRRKRQVVNGYRYPGAYTMQRGSYIRPARVLVPAQPEQVVVVPAPRTEVVPVPVYVPVQVNPVKVI